MSLYVGHIPPHVQHEELERVFRKFGHCTLQMKDGYAFAVFEVSDDAEAALHTLRGKNICGQQLLLSWSKKQPRLFQKSRRLNKFYEPYRRRNFREEGHGMGSRVSRDRRDFSAGSSHVRAYNSGKHRDEVLNRGAGYVHEDIDDIEEVTDVALKGRLTDDGNSSEPNPVAIDRWGEPIGDGVTGNEMHNDDEFDRYEPYHGYDEEDEKEGNQMANSYGSPYHVSSRGNGRKEHPVDEADKNVDNSKPQRACYNCGLKGHIKRHCPEKDTKQEKFGRFSNKRGEINFRDRNDGKLKMPRTSSWGRLDGTRDPLVSSRQERNRKESHSGKSRKLVSRSKNVSERSEKKYPKPGAESQAKKRSKQEHARKKVLKKQSTRRCKSRSVSSDSSSSSSQTRSRTSKSKSHTSSQYSHSTSRSISARSHSVSSHSRSASVSPYRKSKSTRSRSRSRSRSSSHRSLSLSVSLDKQPPSSPLNLKVSEDRVSPKHKLDQPISPGSKHHLKNNMDSFELEDVDSPVTRKVNHATDGEQSGDIINKAHYSAPTSGYEESYSGINLPKDAAAVSEEHRKKSNGQETLSIKPYEQIAVGSEGRNPTRITAQEMIFALKHYGLPAPEEDEPGLSVEGYFGAARLWPWEMIYYRRLKKGPISTENYARRLEQNKEFGIVDRYIRSSSGWGEQE